MKNEIKEYLKKHDACREGAAYALTQTSMKEVWDNCPNLAWLLWMLERQAEKPEKELRLFAVWCARQIQHLMKDKRSLDALDVAERYANGNATEEELTAAERAARAARDAAWAAAWAAALAAEDVAAVDAARAAWGAAAADVAAWTARDAAWAAQGIECYATHDARVKQFKLMIQNPFK